MRRALIVVGMAASCLGVLLAAGCQPDPSVPDLESAPTPIPTPTPVPVGELHQFLNDEVERNPARAKGLEERGQVYHFWGDVTNIEDLTVQFHIEKRVFGSDDYIECAFESVDDFWDMNIGDQATVRGHLASIGNDVKLERCELIASE